MNFYDFKARRLNGKEVSLEEYKGKVVLVVNTASKCGFTPQFAGLANLHDKYEDKNFVILGFPCNQFGRQDPDGDERTICLINYGVRFPMFDRIDVNGANAHPLFLIDKNGRVVKRFAPSTKPEKIEAYITGLL